MSVDWRNASDKVAAFRDEVANRIASIINPMPDISGRQINRLHGEQRRRVEDLAEEITTENARLSRINSELCTSHNALLADGASWETKAKAAEIENSRLHKAVNSARAALDIIRNGDCFQPKLWAGARLRELDETLAASPGVDATSGGEAPVRDDGWQPIETAPRDGTVIQICSSGAGPYAAYYGMARQACNPGDCDKNYPWVILDETNGTNCMSEGGPYGARFWCPLTAAPRPSQREG